MIVHLDIDDANVSSAISRSTLMAIRAYVEGLRADGFAVNMVVSVDASKERGLVRRRKVKHGRQRNRR